MSRVEGSEVLHMVLSVLDCDLMKRIHDCYKTDSLIKALIVELMAKPGSKQNFVWS